ncbi:YfkD family protein [Salipaludibacillus sp. LMS25]|uniref:YfkD famly protein n=1 Tax=Salipaludibacillus sp. LMS25 TaxID=2924031 RepID=UPI0020D0632B|nr:YfkD famly protein [Salipaludibacillus sp. LMS25]UTR13974.1 YfkD family protein [Salipaludibacillus sp. LMS25]
MRQKTPVVTALLICLLIFNTLSSVTAYAESEQETKKSKSGHIPESVIDIAKENTYPNPTQDVPRLQPSKLTSQLLKSTEVRIDNPDLMKMINESTIRSSKIGIGTNISIYLGEWPLSYESEDTMMNWDFEKINTNMVDNRGGTDKKKIQYNQQQQKRIKGGLTAEMPDAEMVKKMMLKEAAEKTKLPLSFSTTIGFGTQTERVYDVAPKTMGYLTAYAPAVNEKGKITYGEVYLKIKRDKVALDVKNVTRQGIGAWIPIQDYINLKLESTKQPR